MDSEIKCSKNESNSLHFKLFSVEDTLMKEIFFYIFNPVFSETYIILKTNQTLHIFIVHFFISLRIC